MTLFLGVGPRLHAQVGEQCAKGCEGMVLWYKSRATRRWPRDGRQWYSRAELRKREWLRAVSAMGDPRRHRS